MILITFGWKHDLCDSLMGFIWNFLKTLELCCCLGIGDILATKVQINWKVKLLLPPYLIQNLKDTSFETPHLKPIEKNQRETVCAFWS